MELKPGYKQSEVGLIPEDWEVKRLGEIGESIIGLTYTPSDVQSDGVLVLRSSNIQEENLKFEDNVFVKTDIPERLMVRPGDILICVRNGSRDLIGKCAHIDRRARGMTFGAFMAVFRSPFHAFAYHQFRSWVLKRQIHEHLGATINQITNRSLNSFAIPVPPTKAEQEAIAEVLSDADAHIESLEQLLTKKLELKQGAMQELLSGKKRLAGFSGEWEAKRIGQFTDCAAGGTPSTSVSQYWGGAIRWMNSGELNLKMVAEVEGRITDEGLRSSSTKLIPSNCVLVGLAGQGKTRGTVAMNLVPLCTNQSIAAISPNASFNSQYLYYNLDSRYNELRELSAGDGGRGGLNLTIIRQVSVPFPDLEEQTTIAATLSDMDSEIAALESKLAKARDLKLGMMQELLTGKIRLTRSKAAPFTTSQAPAAVSTGSRNKQISEAVVIAALVKHFGSDQYPLARKRRTKLSYLLHRHVEGRAEGFLKKAAGPYNPGARYGGAEGIAQRNGYVRSHHNGMYEGFVADANVAQAESYFEKWYGSDALAWLDQFRFKTNDELELLTTVDMAMEELHAKGKTSNLRTVKQTIRDDTEWGPKLDREAFSDENITTAIQACREIFPSEGSAG